MRISNDEFQLVCELFPCRNIECDEVKLKILCTDTFVRLSVQVQNTEIA